MATQVLELGTLFCAAADAVDDFNKTLAAAVLDCRKRPGCSKPRVITLRLDITPDENDPDDVVIIPRVLSKTPEMVHGSFVARSGPTGQLRFDFDDADHSEER